MPLEYESAQTLQIDVKHVKSEPPVKKLKKDFCQARRFNLQTCSIGDHSVSGWENAVQTPLEREQQHNLGESWVRYWVINL